MNQRREFIKNSAMLAFGGLFLGGFWSDIFAKSQKSKLKIAVIGASGKSGSLIVKEALAKGLKVSAIVRNSEKMQSVLKNMRVKKSSVKILQKDLFALSADDLKDYDAVVSAFGEFQNLDLHKQAILHLCENVKNTKIKLYVVGGAGSLYVNSNKKIRLLDTKEFPSAYKPLASAQAEVLYYLQQRDDVNWVFVSPPADFRADGDRSGVYKVGGDELMLNSKGQPSGSYADYALAMVEVILEDKYNKQRISIVSE